MLEVRDLTLAYGERVALRDVSLSLAPGDLLGVVGPNASGKSSLIRAITNVAAPAERGGPAGRLARAKPVTEGDRPAGGRRS